MPVKSAIKPYCYLKRLDSTTDSIYLHNGETSRISREGRLLSPLENPEFIHIRVKPDNITKTLSVIYVSNHKGCWINGCIALCWYKYILNHGHIIRLQTDSYEYQVTFFPPPKTKFTDLLFLKIPQSLTEIPKKVIDELVYEAKMEYIEEKTKVKEIFFEDTEIIEKKAMTKKTKETKKKVPSRKKSSEIEKLKNPVRGEMKKRAENRVHFKTRPKDSQILKAEEEALNRFKYLANGTQTTDNANLLPSASLYRKVIFSTEAIPATKSYKKHVPKTVRFVSDLESAKSVVIVEPDEGLDQDEVVLTKSKIFEMVLQLYNRMQEEERDFNRDKNFVRYLLDKMFSKMYRTETSDLKFIRNILDCVVEDAVTMRENDLAMAKRVIDDVVEQIFIEKKTVTEGGFIEKLLKDIFARIGESEDKVQEKHSLKFTAGTSSLSDESLSTSSESIESGFVMKTVYEID